MSKFADNEWFEVMHCCTCGVPFAVTTNFNRRRIEDRKSFWCPAGHPQSFTGETEAQKLKNELQRKNEILDAANARASKLEANLNHVAKAHRKMRTRVMNGVCPCCNRTFQNLRAHMKTEHADFGVERTLFALRTAFGMTQADVAKEIGLTPPQISVYERGKHVADYAKKLLDNWIESNGGEMV